MKYDFIAHDRIPRDILSFWQSPYWYQILEDSHHVREIFYYGNLNSTFLLIEIRSIGLGQYAAFSLGIKSVQLGADQKDFFQALRRELKSKNVIFLQIEPIEGMPIPDAPILRQQYRKFLTPYTRVIDMSPPIDEIFAKMQEKGRYHIRLAQKRGVIVRDVAHTDENIDIWMRLLHETTERDGFVSNDRHYYETFLRSLGERGQLLFAYWNDTVIAAGICVFSPTRALYYYGASSSDREARKQNAAYLIQWHAIQHAKDLSIPFYDFMGVANPDDPHDPLIGVTMFKVRFGGELVRLPPPILIACSSHVHWFFSLRRIYLSFRSLKMRTKRTNARIREKIRGIFAKNPTESES